MLPPIFGSKSNIASIKNSQVFSIPQSRSKTPYMGEQMAEKRLNQESPGVNTYEIDFTLIEKK
jgi:hypothetical protein